MERSKDFRSTLSVRAPDPITRIDGWHVLFNWLNYSDHIILLVVLFYAYFNAATLEAQGRVEEAHAAINQAITGDAQQIAITALVLLLVTMFTQIVCTLWFALIRKDRKVCSKIYPIFIPPFDLLVYAVSKCHNPDITTYWVKVKLLGTVAFWHLIEWSIGIAFVIKNKNAGNPIGTFTAVVRVSQFIMFVGRFVECLKTLKELYKSNPEDIKDLDGNTLEGDVSVNALGQKKSDVSTQGPIEKL